VVIPHFRSPTNCLQHSYSPVILHSNFLLPIIIYSTQTLAVLSATCFLKHLKVLNVKISSPSLMHVYYMFRWTLIISNVSKIAEETALLPSVRSFVGEMPASMRPCVLRWWVVSSPYCVLCSCYRTCVTATQDKIFTAVSSAILETPEDEECWSKHVLWHRRGHTFRLILRGTYH
jgi:hypothetical protein